MKRIFTLCLTIFFSLQLTADNWNLDLNFNSIQVTDDVMSNNEFIYTLAHYALPPDPYIADAPAVYVYLLTKSDIDGNVLISKKLESSLVYSGHIFNDNNELVIFWQDFYPLIIENGLTMNVFDDDLNITFHQKLNFDSLVNIYAYHFHNNYIYAIGNALLTNKPVFMKLNETLNVQWIKTENDYNLHISYGSDLKMDVAADDEGVWFIYNTTDLPSNATFMDHSSIICRMDLDGNLTMATNMHYEPNYFAFYGSRVHQIVSSNEDNVTFLGTVEPGCDEGCPASVIYTMDTNGSILSEKGVNPDFYNFIDEGHLDENGTIVLYGHAHGDLFGGPPNFTASYIIQLNDELNFLQAYKSNESELDFYNYVPLQSSFNKLKALNNNQFTFTNFGILSKWNTQSDNCNDLEEIQLVVGDYPGSILNPVNLNLSSFSYEGNITGLLLFSDTTINFVYTCQSESNTAPVAENDFGVIQGSCRTVTINPLENDEDPNGDDLTLTDYDMPADVLISWDANTGEMIIDLTYAGAGPTAINYIVCNSQNECDTGTIEIAEVSCPLPPPYQFIQDTLTVTQGDTLNITIDNCFFYSIQNESSLNGIAIGEDQTVQYIATTDFTGVDTLVFNTAASDSCCLILCDFFEYVITVEEDIIDNIEAYEFEFNILPNPVQQHFQINSDKTLQTVRVYDMIGNLIAEFNEQSLYSLQNEAAGIYIVEAETLNGEIFRKKIVKE